MLRPRGRVGEETEPERAVNEMDAPESGEGSCNGANSEAAEEDDCVGVEGAFRASVGQLSTLCARSCAKASCSKAQSRSRWSECFVSPETAPCCPAEAELRLPDEPSDLRARLWLGVTARVAESSRMNFFASLLRCEYAVCLNRLACRIDRPDVHTKCFGRGCISSGDVGAVSAERSSDGKANTCSFESS